MTYIKPRPTSSLSSQCRYERKSIFMAPTMALVEARVEIHPLNFRVEFAPRWVNNIYFDTEDDACLSSHVNGVGSRFKLRYRWYGDQNASWDGQWELKVKNGDVGYKITSKARVAFSKFDQLMVPKELALLEEAFRPKIFNRYLRQYFRSAIEPVRLTLDSDLKFRNLETEELDPDQVEELSVAEFKYPITSNINLLDFEVGGARFVKFSKYVYGRLGLY